VISSLYKEGIKYPIHSNQMSPLELALINNFTDVTLELLKVKNLNRDYSLRRLELYELMQSNDTKM